MRKHRLGKKLLIVLCVVLIVFLAGCRPSPVLEQIIYEQNHQVDPDTETKTMNDDLENEEPDEDIPSRETVDDSEQTKDESHTAALAGDTDTSDDTDAVYDVEYSPYGELSEPDETNPTEGSTSETATGSTEAGGDEGGYAPSGEGEASDGAGDFGGNSGDGIDAGEEQTDGGNPGADEGENQTGNTPEPDSDQPDVLREIVDAAGRKVEIPENVNSVTAVGEAATIVEMLDNSGRLVGTSSSAVDTWSSWNTFDLNGVNTWWDGDGSSDCANMDALLATQPDVCFEISGQSTFSEDQIARLNDVGIAYFVLPALTSIENIEQAVSLVGEVLGDDNAKSKASQYTDWANDVINQVRGKGESKATAYIGRWDPDATWELYNDTTLWSGTGVPVSMSYSERAPLEQCMGFANVVNTSPDNYYVEPVNRLTYERRITGTTATFPTNYTVHILYNEELGVGLGTKAYPAVIVEDSTIKDNILNAEDGRYFRYHWLEGTYMKLTTTMGYGVPDGEGSYISTDIRSDEKYQILVNPEGVGNWVKGSVESPLEAAWVSYEFQSDEGGCSWNSLQEMVNDFYNTFYGISPDFSRIFPEGYTYDWTWD